MHKKDVGKVKKTDLIFSLRFGRAKVGIVGWQGDKEVITLKQVHSSRVVLLDMGLEEHEGDALITQRKGIKIGVRTADCVPIVLVGNSTLSVVHAGWRGIREGIVENTLGVLRELESLGGFLAFIGPSAKACCYEVGEEFKEYPFVLHYRSGRHYMDTQEEVIRRLKKGGVRRLFLWKSCTVCNLRLPSYRREKTKDRLLTFGELL